MEKRPVDDGDLQRLFQAKNASPEELGRVVDEISDATGVAIRLAALDDSTASSSMGQLGDCMAGMATTTDEEFVTHWTRENGWDLMTGLWLEIRPFFVVIDDARKAKTTGERARTCTASGHTLQEAFALMAMMLKGEL